MADSIDKEEMDKQFKCIKKYNLQDFLMTNFKEKEQSLVLRAFEIFLKEGVFEIFSEKEGVFKHKEYTDILVYEYPNICLTELEKKYGLKCFTMFQYFNPYGENGESMFVRLAENEEFKGTYCEISDEDESYVYRIGE